jgi:DNA-binding CsgD family transcriptional regulator
VRLPFVVAEQIDQGDFQGLGQLVEHLDGGRALVTQQPAEVRAADAGEVRQAPDRPPTTLAQGLDPLDHAAVARIVWRHAGARVPSKRTSGAPYIARTAPHSVREVCVPDGNCVRCGAIDCPNCHTSLAITVTVEEHPRDPQTGTGALTPSAGLAPVGIPGRLGPSWHALSQRQRDVCSLLAQGLAGREVARRLGLSETTVRTHVAHAAARLGVSREELVAMLRGEK